MKRLLLVGFFFEIGFVLIVVPWLPFWDRNYFAHVLPPIEVFITNNFVRGAVSGLGVLNVLCGLWELFSILVARTSDQPPSIHPSRFAKD